MNENLLNAIKEVTSTFPEMRFGQLVGNAIAGVDYQDTCNKLFHLTDDELAAKLRQYVKTFKGE